MKPKNQINFYLTNEDVLEIENFAKEKGFVIISPRNIFGGEVFRLDSLLEKPQSLLVKGSAISSLVFNCYQGSNESYVNTSQSPVIEFDRPTHSGLGNKFFFGRFYYQEQIFETNEEYASAVKQLFSWTKKQLKKLPAPSLAWLYASKAVLELIENQNAYLLLNQSPTMRVYFDKQGIHQEEEMLPI